MVVSVRELAQRPAPVECASHPAATARSNQAANAGQVLEIRRTLRIGSAPVLRNSAANALSARPRKRIGPVWGTGPSLSLESRRILHKDALKSPLGKGVLCAWPVTPPAVRRAARTFVHQKRRFVARVLRPSGGLPRMQAISNPRNRESGSSICCIQET